MQTSFKPEDILDLSKTIAKNIFKNVNQVWDVIPVISSFILELGKSLPASEYIEISKNVWASKYAQISETASIKGPVIVEKGAEIRHCAFIRGNVVVGQNVVVGNSTELKNVILFNNVQVPHYNYVGDSILGYKAHMGAGSITSNVKSDKTLVSVLYNKNKIQTSLKKFGAILGDNVEVGCNSVLNPGTIIGKNSSIYPLSMVRGYVPKNSIYKSNAEIVCKINK